MSVDQLLVLGQVFKIKGEFAGDQIGGGHGTDSVFVWMGLGCELAMLVAAAVPRKPPCFRGTRRLRQSVGT